MSKELTNESSLLNFFSKTTAIRFDLLHFQSKLLVRASNLQRYETYRTEKQQRNVFFLVQNRR